VRRKILMVAAVAVLALGTGACTRFESTYMKKVGETDDLRQQLAALQQKYEELQEENRTLKTRIDSLTGELSAMTTDRDTREAEADSLSQRIVELNGKIAVLETENRKLRQDMVVQKEAQKEKVQKVSKTYQDLLEKMNKEITEGQVTISELKGKLTVNMVDAILFDTGKAEIKKEGIAVLEKVVSILKGETEKAIRIEGHTDNVPIAGNLAKRFPTNWELSAARAINVAKFLQERGIDPSVLSAVAYGEYKPIGDNETPEGRAMNRRIEIVLVPRNE